MRIKPKNVLKEIVGRKRCEDGAVIRELACGHFQLEPSGGKARVATQAKCATCAAPVFVRDTLNAR